MISKFKHIIAIDLKRLGPCYTLRNPINRSLPKIDNENWLTSSPFVEFPTYQYLTLQNPTVCDSRNNFRNSFFRRSISNHFRIHVRYNEPTIQRWCPTLPIKEHGVSYKILWPVSSASRQSDARKPRNGVARWKEFYRFRQDEWGESLYL